MSGSIRAMTGTIAQTASPAAIVKARVTGKCPSCEARLTGRALWDAGTLVKYVIPDHYDARNPAKLTCTGAGTTIPQKET